MTTTGSTYRVRVLVPKRVRLGESSLDRDAFYSWMWESLSPHGLLGVHEGTLLSEQANLLGMETESWTIDSGEAPRERDWISSQEYAETELYFYSSEGAGSARGVLSEIPGLSVGVTEEQKAQDWDAEWKASFTGARVEPFWSVLPPWVRPGETPGARGTPGGSAFEVLMRVNPGAGFGTGTHETTQLCLQALGELSMKRSLKDVKVLDFGSGSGILAVAAALLGAVVDGVEIDALAIENAGENASLNTVADRIRFTKILPQAISPYPVVLANILKPVLIEFAPQLVARLASGGCLILSGLMEKDGAEVAAVYSELLGGAKPRELVSGEWRALVWG